MWTIVSPNVWRYNVQSKQNLLFGLLNIWLSPIMGIALIDFLEPLFVVVPQLDITWRRGSIEAMAVCLISADLSFYASHRLSHRFSVLWRLHRLHHSADVMDATVQYRHTIWSIVPNAVVIAFIARVLNFHISSVIYFFGLISLYQIYLHSRISRFPTSLSLLLLSPRDHHLHHHQNGHMKNFGGMLTLWDRVFGTYQMHAEIPSNQLGIKNWKPTIGIKEWLALDALVSEKNGYLLEPASPPASPESPQEPAPSVPHPSPPAPAIKIELGELESNS